MRDIKESSHPRKADDVTHAKLRPLPRPIHPDEPELRHPTRWRVHVEFVPRDVWVGVFVQRWNRRAPHRHDRVPYYPSGFLRVEEQKTYVCLIPCVPIVITRTHETEVPYYGQ